ncbi:hypothetical protein M2103_001015 [Ereboglobus sp. PH5-5]|nr:hypothetical protein [Ereboglobus sp. PH5-5]
MEGLLREGEAGNMFCMNTPPPLFPEQSKTDDGHLRALVICHYVNAGLGLLWLGFIGMHYAFMRMFFSNPEMWTNAQGGSAPPEGFFDIFKWFYVIGAALVVVSMVLNLLSAGCIKARRNRVFSLVVSGLNCLNMPIGTLLGVFTIVVLSRRSVMEVYNLR